MAASVWKWESRQTLVSLANLRKWNPWLEYLYLRISKMFGNCQLQVPLRGVGGAQNSGSCPDSVAEAVRAPRSLCYPSSRLRCTIWKEWTRGPLDRRGPRQCWGGAPVLMGVHGGTTYPELGTSQPPCSRYTQNIGDQVLIFLTGDQKRLLWGICPAWENKARDTDFRGTPLKLPSQITLQLRHDRESPPLHTELAIRILVFYF